MGNDIVWVTGEHPFYKIDKGWFKVCELKVGDKIKIISGSVTLENFQIHEGKTNVYNIEVSHNYNYFISSEKSLVHNKYLE